MWELQRPFILELRHLFGLKDKCVIITGAGAGLRLHHGPIACRGRSIPGELMQTIGGRIT